MNIKKIGAACLCLAMIAGCAQSESEPQNTTESILEDVLEDQSQESFHAALSKIFAETRDAYDEQMRIETSVSGEKINFLNADDLVQMDSTTVHDYTNVRTFYLDDSTVYTTGCIAQQTFTAVQADDTEQKSISAHHDSDDDYTIFSVDETSGSLAESLANDFLAAPLTVQQAVVETLVLNPMENAEYYQYELKQDGDNYLFILTVKDNDEFSKQNLSRLQAEGVDASFFDSYDIEEDTYTLTLNADGVISAYEHDYKAKYVINGIEKEEHITSNSTLSSESDSNLDFLKDLFENSFRENETISVPQTLQEANN